MWIFDESEGTLTFFAGTLIFFVVKIRYMG